MFEATHVLKDLDGERLVEMGSETEQSLLWDNEAFVRDEIGTKIICLARQLRPIELAEDVTELIPPSDQVLSPAAVATRIEAVNPAGLSPADLSRIQINTTSLMAASVAGTVVVRGAIGETPRYVPARSVARTLDDYVQGTTNRPMLAGGELGRLKPKTLAVLEMTYVRAGQRAGVEISRKAVMTRAQCRALVRHGYIKVTSTSIEDGPLTIVLTLAGAAEVRRMLGERE